MADPLLPRYPVYIPSKGRANACLTAKCLKKDGVPFRLVVEPQEFDAYAAAFGESCVIALPFSNRGSVVPARNWIMEHAIADGHARHWQLDDNIRIFYRLYRGERVPCDAGIALAVCEDFTDRYENIAISGLNYKMFAVPSSKGMPPFYLNHHVYSCSLVNNAIPHRWRGRYNEDTDICLQVLADGWCTVLVNAFLVDKIRTMVIRGGNTAELYQGDGRLKMARSLERIWPGVVTTSRRFKRPQHRIKYEWRRFDTPLKLKDGIDLAALKPNEYGMRLNKVAPEIKSAELRELIARYNDE